MLFFFLLAIVTVGYFCYPVFSQEKKPLTPDVIRGFLGEKVISSNRIANLINDYGIDFGELEDISEFLGKLRNDGAEENLIVAVKTEWERSSRILVIETNPSDANVYVDERERGRTGKSGLRIEGLRPKEYTIKVMKEGYEPIEYKTSLLEGNKALSVELRLLSFTEKTTGMEFVFVKGGCFKMGYAFGDGEGDEKPVHYVCVDDFYMGKYEVTVGQFKRFVNETGYRTDGEKNTGGKNGCWALDLDDKEKPWNWRDWASWKTPNKYRDNRDDHPVSCVSWNDAKAFADWLTRKSGTAYRLPTEAEWEYAARGGKETRNYWGNDKDDACSYANVADRSKLPNGSSWNQKHECTDGYTFVAPVGKFQPNGFGLYDMMGNVGEWCQDWYGEKYYNDSPKDNPRGPSSGQYRVLRGGSWQTSPQFVRAANRDRGGPAFRGNYVGFRLSLSAP